MTNSGGTAAAGQYGRVMAPKAPAVTVPKPSTIRPETVTVGFLPRYLNVWNVIDRFRRTNGRRSVQ